MLETLKRGLPARPRYVSSEDLEELKNIVKYGKRYKTVRWEQRASDSQVRILRALSAFRTWRARRGEEFDNEELWDMPPPTPSTLNVYLTYVSYTCRDWRDVNVAALRLYFLHIENPQLFKLVDVPLAKS